MEYDICFEIISAVPPAAIRVLEKSSGRSAVFEDCRGGGGLPGKVRLVGCSCPPGVPVEYPLLLKFFETAETQLRMAARKERQSDPSPVPAGKLFAGCLLGLWYSDEQALLNDMQAAGVRWKNDMTADELYIITGEHLSDVDVSVIGGLRDKWNKARIFTLPGFRRYLKTGVSGDRDRQNYNKLTEHCIFDDDGYFRWPQTEAYPGLGIFNPGELRETGVLAEMGYHVGSRGKGELQRHRILRDAYSGPLPFVFIEGDPDYMKEWNVPKTPWRLRKIACCLAAFVRNMKRRSDSEAYICCIREWESDLAWLKQQFYDGVYDDPPKFYWPY